MGYAREKATMQTNISSYVLMIQSNFSHKAACRTEADGWSEIVSEIKHGKFTVC